MAATCTTASTLAKRLKEVLQFQGYPSQFSRSKVKIFIKLTTLALSFLQSRENVTII